MDEKGADQKERATKNAHGTLEVQPIDPPTADGSAAATKDDKDQEAETDKRKRDNDDDDDDDDKKKEATTTTAGSVDEPKLTKSQQKKKRRLERKMEIKKRRKQQEREAKHERAKVQGRDLEQERREQERRQADGSGKRRRDERFARRLQEAENSFQVCLDCSFESAMTSKEIGSLASQLRYCYATNRRMDKPCLLAATSVSGKTLEHIQNVAGYNEWSVRGFTCTDKSLEEYYLSPSSSSQQQRKRSDLVYLTSDSDNILHELDDSKIYIIGGIVDRNRLKGAAFQRAESLHIATAKLPLDEHLQKMESTRVLTCNHVFDILMHFRIHKNWEKALQTVLPQRKGAQIGASSSSVDGDKDEKSEHTATDAARQEKETPAMKAQSSKETKDTTSLE